MVDVQIRENVSKLMEQVSEEMQPELAKLLLKAATFAGGVIQQTIDGTFKKSSGQLSRSFLPARFVQTDEGVAAAAVSDQPYANIQDVGGTITPRTVRHLAIPLSSEAKNQWPRDWPQKRLFFLEVKRTRNKFLAERIGKKLELHYLLRDSVTIQGTDYLGRAMQAAENDINDILETGLQEMLDQADKVGV